MSEAMDYDVIIVGAGPSGLSAAIKLKQLDANIRVCVLEKGAAIGAHILSGAAFIPTILEELLPDTWQNAPLLSPITHDSFYYLSKNKSIRLPVPPQMKNKGNYIISLGELCQYLGKEAEQLGCDIYPGFPAKEVLYDNGRVIGVKTGAFGIDKNGDKTPQYQEGMCLKATFTLFSEGCRGELSETLMDYFDLRNNKQPQTYALGIKEVWRISPEHHKEGHVTHTVGWPLDSKTYGGSFLYHYSESRISLGLVIGLDYQNPWLNLYEEMQRFKTHPLVKPLLSGAERLGYGARALNEGGYQAIPKLTFPGGALIGDAAGFLNVPQIKGIHNAMQSGIFAAESCFNELSQAHQTTASTYLLNAYEEKISQSAMMKSLYKVRNIHPGFKYGLIPGLINAAFETYISKGHSPWTLKNLDDTTTLKKAAKSHRIEYPKPDNLITFNLSSSVYLSNTYQEKNQPCHLLLHDKKKAIEVNYQEYASPETRFCPAGVYEIIKNEDNKVKLMIHAENCIHCKTCDIKDKNIRWTAPEGGNGPSYMDM